MSILVPFLSTAQKLEEYKSNIIEQRVDFLLDINEGGDADFTSLFEQLELYYDKPLNINNADKSDFLDLGLLNEIQVNNLLLHREKNGKLLGIEELQSIDGFDLEVIRLIQPFVKTGSSIDQPIVSLSQILNEGSSSLFLRYTRILEEQVGFSSISEEELRDNENARYLGDANKLFSRYRFTYSNNLSIGYTGEKDAGEEFLGGSNANGFDFNSAHLFAQGFGIVKQLALGDFQAQFGQGLTFWSGLAFGRSPSIFSLKRNAPKLRPYTSVQEDLFLRGGGITLAKGPFTLTAFYSSQEVDANITGIDTLTNEAIVSSLSEDGFHRTPGELEDKNAIRNTFLGGNISLEKSSFSLGITGVFNEIDADFNPRETVYNQFSLLDNHNINIGSDFSYLYRNLNLFGEVSSSIDGGYAHTVGALIVLDQHFSLGIQHRNFERNFRPIQSNAIGESSTNVSEQGTFIGFEAKPLKHFTLSVFADRFVFDWLRFQTDAPSSGSRMLAQLNFKPNKQQEVYFRYRNRNRERNYNPNEENLNSLSIEKLSNYRLHYTNKISKSIQINSRIEYTTYQIGEDETENGFLIYQDINYKKLSFPLSFSIRYALFDTDSYNSRIYAYENDVLYAFSIPAYNGRGTRFYITTKYKISRGIDIWLRYAQTYFTDRVTIGSGKDAIEGNTRSEIKAQLRLRF